LHLEIDRTKAAEGGFSQKDIADNLLISLSGKLPDHTHILAESENGVSYNLVAQLPSIASDIERLEEYSYHRTSRTAT